MLPFSTSITRSFQGCDAFKEVIPPPVPAKNSERDPSSEQSAYAEQSSQRTLARLNTDERFRPQSQQTGGGHFSPVQSYSNHSQSYPQPPPQPQSQLQLPPQYQTLHAPSPDTTNIGTVTPTRSPLTPAHRTSYQQQQDPQNARPSSKQQSAPSTQAPSQYQMHGPRPQPQTSPSFTQASSVQQSPGRGFPPPGTPQTQHSLRPDAFDPRQSSLTRDNPNTLPLAQENQGQGVVSFGASVVPANSQGQPYRGSQPQNQTDVDFGRSTPQPTPSNEDMTEDEVAQLVKDHSELYNKYVRVKKYYFEKEDQVKQLQNTLAHQRLSQSKTSLDDSEYTTRFSRLDGLIAQLAFSIRKSWKNVPPWMQSVVNRDAVLTGKQEMTAVGRAFISAWLVEEFFERYFHPDLETGFSLQLKTIQKNIRKAAPTSQSGGEEEGLTAKIINWRLTTVEGLQDMLRSPRAATHRQQLMDTLNEKLATAIQLYLQDPAPPDLEGGIHMIIELAIGIATHLPLESRDVQIEYFPPGYSILNEYMKIETGIPPLTTSTSDEADEASLTSTGGDLKEEIENASAKDSEPKKRSMFGGLIGSKKSTASSLAQGKQTAASISQSSLSQRPGSASGLKEEAPPRVRLSAGIAVQIRHRTVLVKAPVFST
ncbi:hypothetical protein BJ546DRAFT_1112428 [Cryomyces antarcticus]